MTYYKILEGRKACHGGSYTYPAPSKGKPGKPTERLPGVSMCHTGYHLVDIANVCDWIDRKGLTLWEAEPVDCEPVTGDDKVVCAQVRLVRKIGDLTDEVLRLWACDCAEDVLWIYERDRPGDTRPRDCIAVARRFALGEASKEELEAAAGEVWAAGEAWASGSAARSAAREAAWAAGAARSAARAAAWAAWAAAGAAARAAARSAALDAALQRYGQLLLDRLEGRLS